MNSEDLKPLIDWLTYRSYEWNRFNNPHLDPLIFRKHYQDAQIFEEIYQQNQKRIYQGK